MTDAEYIEWLAKIQDRYAMESRSNGMFQLADGYATCADMMRSRQPIEKLNGIDVIGSQVHASDGKLALRGDHCHEMLLDAADLAHEVTAKLLGLK